MRPKSCALQLRISPSRSSRNAWSRNTGHCGCSWTHRILATAGCGGKEPSFSFSIVKLASYLDWFRTRLFVKFLFPWEKNNSSASYRTRFAQSQPNPIHQWQACKVSLWHFWCFQANLPGNQEGGQDHTCRLHGVRATSTAAGHDELRQLETHSSSTRHLLCLIVVVLPLHLTINLKGYYECARSGSTGFNGVQWASLGFPLPQPWFSHIQRMLHNFPGANLLPFCFFIPWVFDAFVSLNCKRFHCKMANIYMFFVSFLLQYLFWISFFIKHFHGVHSWAEDKTNIWYLLNRREQQLVRQLDLSFLIQYGMNPCFFENLFFSSATDLNGVRAGLPILVFCLVFVKTGQSISSDQQWKLWQPKISWAAWGGRWPRAAPSRWALQRCPFWTPGEPVKWLVIPCICRWLVSSC